MRRVRCEIEYWIGKYLRIKGQVLKIRACNTAQVAVLQHEWQSHECCITCKYFQYLTFNSQVFILFDFSFYSKKQGIFQYWPLLINTQCSRIFQYGKCQVLGFKKQNWIFLNMLEKLQAKIPSQTSREKFQAKYCKLKIASGNFQAKISLWEFPSKNFWWNY